MKSHTSFFLEIRIQVQAMQQNWFQIITVLIFLLSITKSKYYFEAKLEILAHLLIMN